MRRLCTILLVAGAAVVVTVTTGGSAYAGESTTTRIISANLLTSHSNADFQDDLSTGCGAAHQSNTTAP